MCEKQVKSLLTYSAKEIMRPHLDKPAWYYVTLGGLNTAPDISYLGMHRSLRHLRNSCGMKTLSGASSSVG